MSGSTASRPVHPCVMSVFAGSQGAEFSTWAYLSTRPPACPNLVTAHASTLIVYTMDETTGKLCKHFEFPNLYGSICYLATLPASDYGPTLATGTNADAGTNGTYKTDSLLVGFCGQPRVTIVTLAEKNQLSSSPTVLNATSLMDLTQALIDNSHGSITPLDHDLIATTVVAKSGDRGTIAVVLGGGVAVTCIDLFRSRTHGRWTASEPFLLPLRRLQTSVRMSQNNNIQSSSNKGSASAAAPSSATTPSVASMATGFGDIVSATFLPGYSEPTLVLLHSNPSNGQGRVSSGRLGRPHWQPGTGLTMVVTAISLTVAHKRSAVLWCVDVPVDAISLHPIGNYGCLVMCTNSLLSINNAGRIDDYLAVNGYAKSTCPTRLLGQLKPNPRPFPRLSIQLDGASVAFCSDHAAFLTLRSGVLHILQLVSSSRNHRHHQQQQVNPRIKLGVFPLGRTLGACGHVAQLTAWPLATLSGLLYDKVAGDKEKAERNMSMGLLFAGSRLGESYLMGYAFETVALPWGDSTTKVIGSTSLIREELRNMFDYGSLPVVVSHEVDEIMRIEEEALYDTTSDTQDGTEQGPNVIPPSDDEMETESLPGSASSVGDRETSRVSEVVVLRAVAPLDTITGLGPMMAPCEGPITIRKVPPAVNAMINASPSLVPGAPSLVFPCGYGSSGGLAVLTLPGHDDRSILAQVDCLGVEAVFSLRQHGLVLMGKADTGIRVLRIEKNSTQSNPEGKSQEGSSIVEVEASELLSSSSSTTAKMERDWSVQELFMNATLLSCCDFVQGTFCIVVAVSEDETNPKSKSYGIVILEANSAGSLAIDNFFRIPSKSQMASVSPMMADKREERPAITFACTWTLGGASLVTFDKSGILKVCDIARSNVDAMDTETGEDADHSSGHIVAVDLFYAPSNFFDEPTSSAHNDEGANGFDRRSEWRIDEFQDDVYCISDRVTSTSSSTERVGPSATESWKPRALFLAICRHGGELEVFSVAAMQFDQDEASLWSSQGCGHGLTSLSRSVPRSERQHEVHVCEIRFFLCGPSPEDDSDSSPSHPRPLCLAVETSNGDLLLYAADSSNGTRFRRVPLGTVSRISQEQERFHAKLGRRRIVSATAKLKRTADSEGYFTFQHNKLHRFKSLSGHDGLFAAVARPLWLLSERGMPVSVVHRSQHAAPAGGKAYPLSGFCSNLDDSGSFLTVHERVGRFGTQRLTLYKEISTVFRADGLLPGGGLCFQKVAFGATVRRIQYIDRSSEGSGGSCLYAVLISRELETDSSQLNEDGMTKDEREQREKEKEAAKVKRQVEADLGGFDVEQEWVEDIEREDCFRVEKELGGAPPLLVTTYSLWIVDAANGWMVADSYELGENNHGLAMSVMSLTDFPEEPGSSNAAQIASEDMESTLFITIGIGVVDKNGEDVSGKGKVLLFELRSNSESPGGVELALTCEKEIFHGPVMSLSCLISEGKNRLLIGAGADINVEQWGNGRLTQVGFFRATMQVLDIFVFKNFLLLSDAYDSLYFLVWRESDKSLTLLAKDYDPLVVYAAGIVSRGGSAAFVCQDDRQNLQFFQYAPGEAAARGGNKLVCRADYHLGSQTTAFRNHNCRSSLWVSSASPSSTLAALKQQDAFFGRSEDDQKLGAHFGTTDGGFVAITPLSEPVYWRLAALQSVMANALESDCSLSQRAWRLYKRSHRRGGCRSADRKKGVIDGDLIVKYVDLPLADQEDLASAIGSTPDLILDNILELKCAISVI